MITNSVKLVPKTIYIFLVFVFYQFFRFFCVILTVVSVRRTVFVGERCLDVKQTADFPKVRLDSFKVPNEVDNYVSILVAEKLLLENSTSGCTPLDILVEIIHFHNQIMMAMLLALEHERV